MRPVRTHTVNGLIALDFHMLIVTVRFAARDIVEVRIVAVMYAFIGQNQRQCLQCDCCEVQDRKV